MFRRQPPGHLFGDWPPRRHHAREHVQEYVVKEIHPVLTTYVTNRVYRHVHRYPHTDSQIVQEHQQSFQAPKPPR